MDGQCTGSIIAPWALMLNRNQMRGTARGSWGCSMGTEVPTPWRGWQRTTPTLLRRYLPYFKGIVRKFLGAGPTGAWVPHDQKALNRWPHQALMRAYRLRGC